MIVKKHSVVLMIGLSLTWTGPRAAWPQPPALPQPAGGGRVGTLPGLRDALPAGDLLAGRLHLLSKTLDRAVNDLQHGDLKRFAQDYQRMVDAYTTLTDHVGTAAESIGAAGMRVELARESLADAGKIAEPDPQQRRQLADDINQVRTVLLSRLAAQRSELDRADAAQRDKLLKQMQALVARIRQLDQLKQTFEEGARALLPGLAADQLGRQLDEIDAALGIEQRMLNVVAQAARRSVEALTAQVQRTMLLLEVEAQIPREQLQQLTATRDAVQTELDEILQAHQRAAQSATAILAAPQNGGTPLEPGPLLEQVDRLLGEGERRKEEG